MTWAAYLREVGFSQDKASWINIDETAIPFHVGGRAGNRLLAPTKKARTFMAEKASLQQKRASCTFMAAAANDPEVQKGLPQVLLPNMKGHKKKWKNSPTLLAKPKGIRIMENTNGWSTVESMIEYLGVLKKELDAMGKKTIVLVMDCHSSHMSYKTLQWLKKNKWGLLLVPSKMTFMLQPLDAYVFATFKQRLFEVHAANKIESANDQQSFEEWLSTTVAVIQDFFQNLDGGLYFSKCGLVSTRHISETIKDHIVPDALGMVRKLTSAELKEYVGGRKIMLDHQIFWKTLPEWSKGRPVYQLAPTFRLRSKTSFAVE